MKVGEVEHLVVIEILSDFSQGPISADWLSDRPSILSVNAGGAISAIAFGSATVTAVFESGRLTRSMHVVPDTSGRWAGQLRFVSCVHESGSGSGCPIGLAGPFAITLAQVHDELSGTIVQGFNGEFAGPLIGSVSEDGTMTASETIKGEEEVDTITDWQTQVRGSSRQGRFNMRRRFTNVFGPQVLFVVCELVDVTKP